jgi:REP element-mobilizing transposase RayT
VILATHVIISCYGFWLPNEERGSWSDFVRSYELYKQFGPSTKLYIKRSTAHDPHDKIRREAARASLKYPFVRLTGRQALAVAHGFATMIEKSGYAILACAIMPDHIHLVIARFRYDVVQVANLLKGAATRQLLAEGIHPLQEYRANDGSIPSPWSSKVWKVFLDCDYDVRRAIQYTEENPEKDGLKPQKWGFVVPYDTWRAVNAL